MDRSEVNIDIVFRNGLKDYEVLPPPEVWDNIHPLVKIRQKPILFLRAAAMIAIVLSVSFLAYLLSLEFSTGTNGTFLALNVRAEAPIKSNAFSPDVTGKSKEINLLNNSQEALTQETRDIKSDVVIDKTDAPDVAILRETGSLSTYKAEPLHRPFVDAVSTSYPVTQNFTEPELQYIPGYITPGLTQRWSIAAIASPTYNSSFNSGSGELSQKLMASEKNLNSYSGGVAFAYKVNKRLSIQSGLFYSSVGQLVEGINSFAGFQRYDVTKGDHNFEVLTTSGVVYTNNGDVFLIATGSVEKVMTDYTIDVFDPKKASLQYLNSSIRQNFSYIELPVVLRYKFIDKKIDFNVIGGVSYNMLVNNSVYTVIEGARYPIGKTEGLNQASLSSSLGMGMEYNFSEKLSLNLEPTFRYYLNPYNKVTGSTIHPYSFGLFSGVSYKF